jgi:hypothetical protein
MYDESIACYRDLSPAVPPIPRWGKRARRGAVIGTYPDVLVSGGPPTERLLQGDALPRRCQLFRLFGEADPLQFGPITAARPLRIRRRHAPSPGALRPAAGGRIPHRGDRTAGARLRGAFVRTNAITGRDVLPPSLKRGVSAGCCAEGSAGERPSAWRPAPAGDIGWGAPVLVPPRRMGEGPPLLEVRQHVLRCAARAAGPTPGPGPTAWAHRIGWAQASDWAGTYAPGRLPRPCAAAQRTISPRA